MIFCYGKWLGTSWAADAKFAWYQDQDTRFLLSMMVEFCHQSSNVLYLIIHLYVWILILRNATWSLWAIVFLTTIAAFCTLFAAVEAILSHFVKFFKNHTVFYMAQLLLALIFVILFDTQFFFPSGSQQMSPRVWTPSSQLSVKHNEQCSGHYSLLHNSQAQRY